ncbi:MAG: ABC transporter ATP-binding protein [Deltaproteobacteria bacterium]|nr:ABC transporter ATP-binding protein [Deltaproteobacteria bacterium]
MLEIQGLNVFYGDVHILWDVSMHVSPGEIVTVIGPNGAGKSTLLKAIVKLMPVAKDEKESGKILFNGQDLDGLSPEETVRLGMAIVPEGARVFPEMTVLENLQMGSYIETARALRKEALEEVFSLFPRLKERLHQKAKTLSGGERQMLAIGRALMSKPLLMLLDEPSLGLQPALVVRTFAAVKEINRRGVAVLLVEQNVQFSLEISHRAYVLENGRIALEGKASELLGSEHIKKFYLAM